MPSKYLATDFELGFCRAKIRSAQGYLGQLLFYQAPFWQPRVVLPNPHTIVVPTSGRAWVVLPSRLTPTVSATAAHVVGRERDVVFAWQRLPVCVSLESPDVAWRRLQILCDGGFNLHLPFGTARRAGFQMGFDGIRRTRSIHV